MVEQKKSKSKTIPKAVISRLPRYYRYLRELIEEGVERISSEELSSRMGATASQIRQDLNHFGGFGQQGYGYKVKSLYNEIANILGVGDPIPMIVVGAGNLGRAIVKYSGFKKHGFVFKALFDVDDELCNKSVGGVRIRNMSELKKYVETHKVGIAAITLPRQSAKKIAAEIYDMGIRYFWNFAQTDLALPKDAIVKNVHLLDSLLELSYSISSEKK